MHSSPIEPTTDDDLSTFYDANPDLERSDLDDSPSEVGARIAQARTEAGMTATELATQLGVRLTTLERWESGRSTPRPNRLTTIAGLLGVGVSWLLMGHGESPNEAPDLDGVRSELVELRRSLASALATVDALTAQLAVLETRSG